METRYLKTLVEAIEKGSFSKAADALHITQSAVSQRIKFLEEQYGHQLIDRSGAILEPTPIGKLVLVKAHEILKTECELIESLRQKGAQKRLAICCTPSFGMAYLPQILSDFIRSHSDLNDLKFVFKQPQESLQGLRNEEFDLAIIEHCLDQSFAGFERFPLPDDELVFVLPKSASLPDDSGFVSLEELSRFRLFARQDGCSSKEMLRSNLASQNFDFNAFDGVVVSDDLHFTIRSVLEGKGVAYVSTAVVNSYLQSGQLISLRVKGFVHGRGRCVAVLPHRREDPLLQEFLECIFRIVSPLWRPQLVIANA
jgi:DNA-binding transcriptional LysR family regulator